MKIDDYIFSETDDSCARCGQKELKNLTRHHIDENKKNNEYENLIVLCWNCHYRFHQKKEITETEIKSIKKRLIMKTLTQFGVNALKIAHRNKMGVAATSFLLLHLVEMGYLKQKSTLSSYYEEGKIVSDEILFMITPKGEKLLRSILQMSKEKAPDADKTA